MQQFRSSFPHFHIGRDVDASGGIVQYGNFKIYQVRESAPNTRTAVNQHLLGPGVRIALYLQSILSVLLIRFSPSDAPGAYWSMTSTAMSLIISSIVTSVQGEISLLDAIVVVYVLLLPVLASAFGLSEIMQPTSGKHAMRSVHSPLLIAANWTRSALTYSFALYVWISASTFGSNEPGCNQATKFIFFGAKLPALGSGRVLNLVVWGILTFLFLYRAIKGSGTIFVAFQALISRTASQALLRPKNPTNEVHRERVTRKNFATGEVSETSRLFRPRQVFHELVQGLASQILSWAPEGTESWYRYYGKAILITILAIWAIIMTELELALNDINTDSEWGFGQILPLVLTISPLFSLYESILSRYSSGPTSKSRVLRFTIRSAHNISRPQCELDPYPPEYVAKAPQDEVRKMRAPTSFAVVTVDEREMYTTFEMHDEHDPEWEESFDMKVDDLSTVVVRVFDRKCIDNGWPAFVGFAVVHPFTVLPHPKLPPPRVEEAEQQGGEVPPESAAENTHQGGSSDNSSVDESQGPAGERQGVEGDRLLGGSSKPSHVPRSVELELPLVRDGITVPGMTVSIRLSTDVRGKPVLPPPPPYIGDVEETRVERRVALVKFRNKIMGRKKETTTRVYQMADLS